MKANPCNACLKKLAGEDNLNYHSVSDCCWNTTAALAGVDSNISIRDSKNCTDCVIAQIPTVLGFERSTCNLTPKVPPIWHQAPHLFPDMFRRTGNAPGSLNECILECQSNNLPGECCDNCRTDYLSIEPYQDMHNQSAVGVPQHNKDRKAHPWFFWISFALVAIALSAILVSVIRSIYYPKHYRKV